MIERLKLNNFTVFNELDIKFSSGINVIIGKNATGKTHLLKAAYALCSGNYGVDYEQEEENAISPILTKLLVDIFRPEDDKLGRLARRGSEAPCTVCADLILDKTLKLRFGSKSSKVKILLNNNYDQYRDSPVFIPAKEILTLIRGFCLEKYENEEVQAVLSDMFDLTYFDLADSLWTGKTDARETEQWHIEEITNLLGGRFHFKEGYMNFQTGEYIQYSEQYKINNRDKLNGRKTYFKAQPSERISPHMMAEGFRKLGMLQRLLKSGTISPGISGTLFWDEPEANMNPELMKLLVEVILELSRNGQQVIIATHDHVLLKWLDLLADNKKEDHVLFHTLYRDGDTNEITLDSVDQYQDISHNAIAGTFDNLVIEYAKLQLKGHSNA